MIIKIALILLLIALALFLSDDFLIELSIPKAPELVTQLGLIALFIAFSMIFISGLIHIFSLIIQSLLNYFSAHERIRRRLLFIEAKQLQLKQLFFFKARQINYVHETNKSRLLTQDNKRQIKALLIIIDKDLILLKGRLPKSVYLDLIKARKHFINDQNLDGLLELQQTIANHVLIK